MNNRREAWVMFCSRIIVNDTNAYWSTLDSAAHCSSVCLPIVQKACESQAIEEVMLSNMVKSAFCVCIRRNSTSKQMLGCIHVAFHSTLPGLAHRSFVWLVWSNLRGCWWILMGFVYRKREPLRDAILRAQIFSIYRVNHQVCQKSSCTSLSIQE